MRAAIDELLELRAIFEVVTVAEQDDSVGLAAVLIIDMPVGRELLDRDQEVVTERGAAPHHRPDQRQIERIEEGRVRPLLEKQQGERLGALPAQARGILVDGVMELLGGLEHALARFLADRRITRQGA